MAQYVAITQLAKVNGETILSVVKGMPHFKEKALRILEEQGIVKPAAGQWYSQQAWLNAFKQIAEGIGEQTLFQIGKQIPHNAQWPPQVDNITKALASIDIAYHMNHQINGKVLFDGATGQMTEGIGHYAFEGIDPKSVKITCDNPYPCEFDKGILKGAVEKFKTADINEVVFKHGKTSCRKNGDHQCIYMIEW
jgi:hypothetical protein